MWLAIIWDGRFLICSWEMQYELHMFDLKSTAHCSTPHHLYYSAVQPYTRTNVHFYGCRSVNGYQQSDAWIMFKIIKTSLNCTPFHQQQKLCGWLLGWGEHRLPVMLGWGEHRLPVVLGWDEHRLTIALGWGGHVLAIVLGWGEHRLAIVLGWGEHMLAIVLGWGEHRLAIVLGWGEHMLAIVLGWGEHRLAIVLGWGEHRLAIVLGELNTDYL